MSTSLQNPKPFLLNHPIQSIGNTLQTFVNQMKSFHFYTDPGSRCVNLLQPMSKYVIFFQMLPDNIVLLSRSCHTFLIPGISTSVNMRSSKFHIHPSRPLVHFLTPVLDVRMIHVQSSHLIISTLITVENTFISTVGTSIHTRNPSSSK